MAKRLSFKKKSQFILPPPPPIPQNTCWIESDSYDRKVYRQLREESPSLQALEESGNTLVPQFDSLLQDLFCALFKYNVLFLNEDVVLPSATLNKTLLDALHQGELAQFLRQATVLDEIRAGLATVLLGEGALKLLKSDPESFTREGDGWVARSVTIQDLSGGTSSELKVEKIDVDVEVPDRMFTLSYLERRCR